MSSKCPLYARDFLLYVCFNIYRQYTSPNYYDLLYYIFIKILLKQGGKFVKPKKDVQEEVETQNTEQKTPTADNKYEIKTIPLNNLIPFKDHPFKLYKNEKLEKLAESISVNGVIQPIIVRPIGDGNYEIISGHNRKAAVEWLKHTDIPAVIREDLTDDEVIILTNESNISQRTFSDWEHSEKAQSITQYHDVIKRQGSRTDLKSDTSVQNEQKWNARKATAKAYGVDENVITRYLQVNQLIKPLIERLDNKEFGLIPAINLAHIPREAQTLINSILDEDKSRTAKEKIYEVNGKNSHELKVRFGYDNLTNYEIKELLKKDVSPVENSNNNNCICIPMPNDKYNKLFPDKSPMDAVKVIETAVEYYKEQNFIQPKSHAKIIDDEEI